MKKRIHEGFTVLEFLIVIAIMAILVGLILVGLNAARANARDQEKIANLQRVAIGIQQYQDICRQYPADLNDQQACSELQSQNKTFADLVPDIMNFQFNSGGDYNYIPLTQDQDDLMNCSNFHLWVRLERDNATTNAARFDSTDQGGDFWTCQSSNPQPVNAKTDLKIYDIYK